MADLSCLSDLELRVACTIPPLPNGKCLADLADAVQRRGQTDVAVMQQVRWAVPRLSRLLKIKRFKRRDPDYSPHRAVVVVGLEWSSWKELKEFCRGRKVF